MLINRQDLKNRFKLFLQRNYMMQLNMALNAHSYVETNHPPWTETIESSLVAINSDKSFSSIEAIKGIHHPILLAMKIVYF